VRLFKVFGVLTGRHRLRINSASTPGECHNQIEPEIDFECEKAAGRKRHGRTQPHRTEARARDGKARHLYAMLNGRNAPRTPQGGRGRF